MQKKNLNICQSEFFSLKTYSEKVSLSLNAFLLQIMFHEARASLCLMYEVLKHLRFMTGHLLLKLNKETVRNGSPGFFLPARRLGNEDITIITSQLKYV